MSLKDMDFERRFQIVKLIDATDASRRVAHGVAKELPEMQQWADEADALHRRLAEAFGVEPKPVFDTDDYIRQQVAAGHPDFEPYERSHGEPSPPQGRGLKQEETMDEAVDRLLEAGWDFTDRCHAWSDEDDGWREEIEDVLAYNFGPGEAVRKRGSRKTGEVRQVHVGPDGDLMFNVEGVGIIRDDLVVDARDVHHFWGMIHVDHADDAIYAIELTNDRDEAAAVWRIDGTPERPFMHAYRASTRRELILNIYEDVGGGCLLGEFTVLRSPDDERSAILVHGLDVKRASSSAEDVALTAIADFESSAPAADI